MNQNDNDYSLVCKKVHQFSSHHLEAEPERVVAVGVAETRQSTEDLPHVQYAIMVIVKQVNTHGARGTNDSRLQHFKLRQRRIIAISASAIG
jgi:hypothetical protein